MVYNPNNLSVLAFNNGFTLWHYVTTTDTREEVLAPGYFNTATDMLRAGDRIDVNILENATVGGATSKTIATMGKSLLVRSIENNVVTTSPWE